MESNAFRIKPVGLKRWVKQCRSTMGIVWGRFADADVAARLIMKIPGDC